MNRCLECGIGAGEKIIYNVRCEHYKLFFLFLIKLAALGAFFRKPTSPPLPLREGPPLISVFSPQGRRGNRSSSSL